MIAVVVPLLLTRIPALAAVENQLSRSRGLLIVPTLIGRPPSML